MSVMKQSPEVSVLMPAFNEFENLEGAIIGVSKTLKKIVSAYEIVVIDDGSTDGTKELLTNLAKKYSFVTPVFHTKNLGLSMAIRSGITASHGQYVTQFHGDNDTAMDTITRLVRERKKADLIVSFMADDTVRTPMRRIASVTFIQILTTLTGVKMKYFNGFFICKTSLLRSVKLESTGYVLYAEAKIKLIKRGATFQEVPFTHVGRKNGMSKAFLPANLFRTATDVLKLAMWVVSQ